MTVTSSNVPKKGHKRQQASIGLGIVTLLTESPLQEESVSKNNTFFDTTCSTLQIKPPPSLIHVVDYSSTIKDNTLCHLDGQEDILSASPPSFAPSLINVVDYSTIIKNNTTTSPSRFADLITSPPLNDTSIMDYSTIQHNNTPVVDGQQPSASPPSFADRIRSIVLANRKSVTPIMSDDTSSICSTSSSQSFPEDKIIPLPSPAQVTPTNKYAMFTPALAIPIISLSPNFSPNKTNIIPPLLQVPMLGDIDEDENTTMAREYYNFPIQHDDDALLIGKHIWKFQIQHVLGVGAFSKVYLADNIQEGGKRFAVKMIHKERMRQDARLRSSIEREVGVLKFLDHDHIVQLEATMETEHYLCIVLEYVQGEELFDLVQRMHTDIHKAESKSNIDEGLVKRLALELIQVVSWLHDHNIVHRDLKLENILVYYDSHGESHLKLTDFGLARIIDPQEPTLTTRCGSEEYAAPEIVQSRGYDGRLTDTWSIGIILYALLVGYLPFSYNPSKGEKTTHLFHRIVLAHVKWPRSDHISMEAKHVVERILVRKPEKRIGLNELEKLAWFINYDNEQ